MRFFPLFCFVFLVTFAIPKNPRELHAIGLLTDSIPGWSFLSQRNLDELAPIPALAPSAPADHHIYPREDSEQPELWTYLLSFASF